MKVILYFSAQFCGSTEIELEIPNNSSDLYIEDLFEKEIGVKFNKDYCAYKILKNYK